MGFRQILINLTISLQRYAVLLTCSTVWSKLKLHQLNVLKKMITKSLGYVLYIRLQIEIFFGKKCIKCRYLINRHKAIRNITASNYGNFEKTSMYKNHYGRAEFAKINKRNLRKLGRMK